MQKLLSTVAIVCSLLVVLVFACWMNLISYITAGNLIKTKIYIYLYMYYEILIYWVLLPHFSFKLPLFRQCFFFPSTIFFFIYLFFNRNLESLWKEQLKGILLNIYVFNWISFTKLYSLLATFVNTQETFERCERWY